MSWYSTSQAGFDLIERFEGLEKKRPDGMIEAYKVGNDPWTVGIGQTGQMPDGRPVQQGLLITEREARDALQYFVRNVTEPLVRKHFNARTQYEFDALVSWTYNISAAKLEAGKYSLPGLVNLRDRDINAIIDKLTEYVNPKTIFEQGLYRRRLAEACMFLGLPWHFALSAVLKRVNGIIVEKTDPYFVIDVAEAAAEREEAPPEPVKPVPAPKAPEAAKPAPAATPAPVGTKAPSPNTKAPADVPYKIDPNAGLKPLEESERAVGYFWQNMARLLLRLTGMGTFGTAAAGVANVVQSDAVLGSALMDLTIPMLVVATGFVIAFVAKQYGDWKRQRGEAAASQGLF